MDRRIKIMEFIKPGSRGIEIGPWHAPLAPKKDGWQTLVLDVFSAELLRQRAQAETPDVQAGISRIEEVDLLGSATEIAALAEAAGHAPASFDFVISSHNLEHVPDPIRFLQGVEKVLKPGGVLSMILPDRRLCFDHLRAGSSLGQLLEANAQGRQRPSAAQVFDYLASQAAMQLPNGSTTPVFPLRGFDETILARRDIKEPYALFEQLSQGTSGAYVDAHCWTFTPAEMSLHLAELRSLGLIRLELAKVWPSEGIEFVIHMRKPTQTKMPSPEADLLERQALLHDLMAERSATHDAWERPWKRRLRRWAKGLRDSLKSKLGRP